MKIIRALIFIAKNDTTDCRLQVGLILHELLLQMAPRKFEGGELMMVVRAARRRERFAADGVVATISRRIINFSIGSNLAAALEIQTKLKTARVKCASPVERTLGPKVVPLDRDACLIDIAVKRAPSVFHLTPSVLLGRTTRIHLT